MKTLERIYTDAEEYTASDLVKTNQNILTSEELLIHQAYFDGAKTEHNKALDEAIHKLVFKKKELHNKLYVDGLINLFNNGMFWGTQEAIDILQSLKL